MKAPIVKRIIVKRFRSIPAADIVLNNPLFVVGRNGSGKSNFADIFSFIADAMRMPLEAVFDNRAGVVSVRHKGNGKGYPPNLGIRVELGDDGRKMREGFFSFEIKAQPDHGFEVVQEQCSLTMHDGSRVWYDRRSSFKTNVTGIQPPISKEALCLPLVSGDERFAPIYRVLNGFRVYSIVPQTMKELQDADAGTAMKSDGSNAASVLRSLARDKETFDRLLKYLAVVVPGTDRVASVSRGNKMTVEFKQDVGEDRSLKFDSFNMSDGTVRVLGILLALMQNPRPSLVVIEEPETTIHPGALGAVMDAITEAAADIQVVVTTHSPELLDAAKWIQKENLRCLVWEKGVSHILETDDSVRDILKEHLAGAGELLRSNALNPSEFRLFTKSFKPEQLLLFSDLA